MRYSLQKLKFTREILELFIIDDTPLILFMKTRTLWMLAHTDQVWKYKNHLQGCEWFFSILNSTILF